MNSVKSINIFEQPISQIFDLIPEIKALKGTFLKNRLYKFCESKISKIEYKLNHSPYIPYTAGEDRLNLNRDFSNTICKWLAQFPEEKRLGFFLIILSIVYISEKEMDTFLEIAIEKLCYAINEKEAETFNLLEDIEGIKCKIISFPLSDSGIYDKFVHKMGIERTLDRDRRPFRGQLGEYLYDIFLNLRQLAETDKEIIYWEMWFDSIRGLISSFLNSYIVLVEDYTFSGRTIKSDIQKLLHLIKIVFEPFGNIIEKQGYKLPQFFLLVPIATYSAVEEINSIFAGDPIAGKYFNSPVTGYGFDYDYRAIRDIPKNIWELKDIFPKKIKLFTHLQQSLQFFHKEYSKKYWVEETNIMSRSPFSIDDYVFGYAKGAWPIVTWRNSPNNSLPPIWYPHRGSPTKDIMPLFQRVETRKSHAQREFPIEENMEIAQTDKNGYLKQILKEYYERNL